MFTHILKANPDTNLDWGIKCYGDKVLQISSRHFDFYNDVKNDVKHLNLKNKMMSKWCISQHLFPPSTLAAFKVLQQAVEITSSKDITPEARSWSSSLTNNPLIQDKTRLKLNGTQLFINSCEFIVLQTVWDRKLFKPMFSELHFKVKRRTITLI